MKFAFIADEAQGTAIAMHRWLKASKHKVSVDALIATDAPYRTTLTGRKAGMTVLVEIQHVCRLDRSLEDLVMWLRANDVYCELRLAVPESSDVPAGVLRRLGEHGMGLLAVDASGAVRVLKEPRNFALLIALDPTLALGARKTEITKLVEKFNGGNRKDALRDMCEIVEDETDRLTRRAVTKGRLTVTMVQVDGMDWSDKINTLASTNQAAPGTVVIVDAAEKHDFHSFRGARNLLDHPVRDRRQEKRRQQQFVERMVQGPRLVALLLRLRRALR